MTEVDDGLGSLADTAAALAGELGLDAVLQTITAAAARLTGARYAALGVIGDDQTISRFVTHGADDETIRAIGHYPTGKGLLGLLIRDPRVIRLDDLHAHPASAGFPPHHPEMTTFLGAPIRSGGIVYGNLYLTEKGGGFDERDERLLLVLAAQAGAAIENALLSERLRSLAVQAERDRISRDLHDGVIQTLFSIGMSLESARTLLGTDLERVDDRLNSAVDGIDGAIRELRNSIFHLRPQEAAALGLTGGLAELAREYEVNAVAKPELLLMAGLDHQVPDMFVPDLLQVVREALSNAARHADATTVRIAATVDAGRLHLVVADDGAGFDTARVSTGRGLANIVERVEAMGGRLELVSATGDGTRVELDVPLQEDLP